jgi:arylsulfatase A-like enzyme
MLGEHGLRGTFCSFEPSVRLPLIASPLGAIPLGSRTSALTDQADYVPTFLELGGIGPATRSRPFKGQRVASVLADPALIAKLLGYVRLETTGGSPR